MPSRCGAPAILKRKHRRREADAPLLTVTRSPRPFPVLRLSSDWVASSFIAMNALSRREEETLTKTAKAKALKECDTVVKGACTVDHSAASAQPPGRVC